MEAAHRRSEVDYAIHVRDAHPSRPSHGRVRAYSMQAATSHSIVPHAAHGAYDEQRFTDTRFFEYVAGHQWQLSNTVSSCGQV